MRPDSLRLVRGRQTRIRILVAARARILTDGFEALRLDDLARDAGVTKAAVVKSVGGKASILLALGEEDRQTRLAVIREAILLRTGLRRRLGDVVERLLELDYARLNIVMAYIGYMWFWTRADHARAQAMVDDTQALLCELIEAASPALLPAERVDRLSRRLLSGYVMGLRDVNYGRATIRQSVQMVVSHCLD
jgi:AcrR family transcriptional regulator